MENALGEAQTIVLLGGTSDIGRAIVSRAARRPSTRTVVLAARRPGRGRRRRARAPGRWTVDVVPFDAADSDQPRGLRRRTWPTATATSTSWSWPSASSATRPSSTPTRPGPRRMVHVNYTGAVSVGAGRGRPVPPAGPRPAGRAVAAWPASGCARPTSSTARRRPASTASPRAWVTRWPAPGPACSSCGPASCTRRMTQGLKAAPVRHHARRRSPRRRSAALRRGRRTVWVPAHAAPASSPCSATCPARVWRRLPAG